MRVVVAPDSVGPLSAADAGRAIADGWPLPREVVVPLGESGAGFAQAAGDLLGGERRTVDDHLVVRTADRLVLGSRAVPVAPAAPIPEHGSSAALGRALRECLDRADRSEPPSEVVIDLAGPDVHDGGAGLLAELGATADVDLRAGVAGLAGLTRVDLSAARARLAGRTLVAVTDAAGCGRSLLGLRGITAARGREAGQDAALLLDLDARLQRWAGLLGLDDRPGAGAAGGVGAAVLALGGRLTTGPGWGAGASDLASRMRGADLVVTGCSRYDFATRGGGVVAEVARLAADALAPCVVLAGEVMVGRREMRTMGVEAAYPVFEADPVADFRAPGAADLAALAARVARSWRW